MKRAISLLLALIFLFGGFSVIVCAAGGGVAPMYYVKLPAENEKFIIEPVEGYEVYVVAGEPFEFYIEPKEGYSVKVAIVSINGTVAYNTDDLGEYFTEEHVTRRYFKIASVKSNTEVFVTNVNTEENANMFAFLIRFFTQIVEFFQKLFSGEGFSF